jgi:hypothetical protein
MDKEKIARKEGLLRLAAQEEQGQKMVGFWMHRT